VLVSLTSSTKKPSADLLIEQGATQMTTWEASEEEVTRLTRMLCQLCRAMERSDHFGMFKRRVPGLATWWREHQIIAATAPSNESGRVK